jgi:hydrogenase maturation protease
MKRILIAGIGNIFLGDDAFGVHAAQGGSPGTLYTIEPDMEEIDSGPAEFEAHGMNPVHVLKMARAMGGATGRILLVGCEPETLGPEEGKLGLSATVEEAVERAIPLVESFVMKLLAGETLGASAVECLQKEAV